MYDVVWYWVGGTEMGRWHDSPREGQWPEAELRRQREAIRRQGYVAHLGRRSLGAPEGPPTAQEIKEVTSFWQRRVRGLEA